MCVILILWHPTFENIMVYCISPIHFAFHLSWSSFYVKTHGSQEGVGENILQYKERNALFAGTTFFHICVSLAGGCYFDITGTAFASEGNGLLAFVDAALFDSCLMTHVARALGSSQSSIACFIQKGGENTQSFIAYAINLQLV